jgi:hypothetical protein
VNAEGWKTGRKLETRRIEEKGSECMKDRRKKETDCAEDRRQEGT